jgi:hypothetical protein
MLRNPRLTAAGAFRHQAALHAVRQAHTTTRGLHRRHDPAGGNRLGARRGAAIPGQRRCQPDWADGGRAGPGAGCAGPPGSGGRAGGGGPARGGSRAGCRCAGRPDWDGAGSPDADSARGSDWDRAGIAGVIPAGITDAASRGAGAAHIANGPDTTGINRDTTPRSRGCGRSGPISTARRIEHDHADDHPSPGLDMCVALRRRKSGPAGLAGQRDGAGGGSAGASGRRCPGGDGAASDHPDVDGDA